MIDGRVSANKHQREPVVGCGALVLFRVLRGHVRVQQQVSAGRFANAAAAPVVDQMIPLSSKACKELNERANDDPETLKGD